MQELIGHLVICILLEMASSGVEEVTALLSLVNRAAQAALAAYATYGVEVPSIYAYETHPLDSAEDTLTLKAAIRTLEGACSQLCATLAPPSYTVYKGTTNNLGDCLSLVIEAKIADIVAKYPEGIHVRQIAESIGADEGKLDQILRRVSTKNFFCEVSPHVYAPTRLTGPLLSTDMTGDICYLPYVTWDPAIPAFCSTITSPKLGKSYDTKDAVVMQSINSRLKPGEDKYIDFYHWISTKPDVRRVFDRGMVGLERVLGCLNVLHHYPWSNVTTVCDVGSGVGGFSMALAKAYPQIKITLLDLPNVIDQAKLHWAQGFPEALANNVDSGRVFFAPGSILEDVDVPNKDVYYLRHILHNWPDEECRIILHNIRQAMKGNPHSRVLIHDFVIQYTLPTKPETVALKNQTDTGVGETCNQAPYPLLSNFGAGNEIMYDLDMIMLLLLNGQERPLDRTLRIANEAGFEFVHIWDVGEMPLIELKVANVN